MIWPAAYKDATRTFVERIAALDPVVDTSSGGCCDSSPELTCGLCGRRTHEYTEPEIDRAGYVYDVRDGKTPFVHRFDCPWLLAKDIMSGDAAGVERRRAEDLTRQARLILEKCVYKAASFESAWIEIVTERDRILATVDPERGRPTRATPNLPTYHPANLYLDAAVTGAMYALALFASTST